MTTKGTLMTSIHPEDLDLPPFHDLDITWAIDAALALV